MEPDSPGPKNKAEKLHDLRSRLLDAMANRVKSADQVSAEQAERIHQAAERISKQGAKDQSSQVVKTRWDEK